ncbi:MAG: hypothetical protein FWG53_06560 [Clostridiales bacterium]|nr:hypothetical protein [Clostridiales bacterium]
MSKRRKKSKVVLSVILAVLIVNSARCQIMSVFEAYIAKIDICEYNQNRDPYIEEHIMENVAQDPSRYCYVVYRIEAENISKRTYVVGIDIQPVFTSEMQSRVVFFYGTDAITPLGERLPPQSSRGFNRWILIDRQELTDQEVQTLANGNGLEIRYKTTNWIGEDFGLYGVRDLWALLNTGYHKCTVKLLNNVE